MRNLILCGCMLFAISCGEAVIEKPENLVPRETMVDLLYDLSIIHAAKGINPAILKEKNMGTMDYLFEKYGIDSIQFLNSDTYYASIPNEYESIYKEVVARLDKTKVKIEEERKRVNDSVKEAVKQRKSPMVKDSIKKNNVDVLP